MLSMSLCVAKLLQSYPTLCNPMGCSPGLSLQGILQARYWSGSPCPSPGTLPNPGIEPRSSTLQVDCLPSEPAGKAKSTGVGSIFLLQDIFPKPGIELCSPALQEDSLPAEL